MSRDKTHWEECWRVHHECAIAKIERQSEADQRDTARLRHLGDEPFCDEYGGVDLHERASLYASALAREEPNSDDYLAAVRDAIDAAMSAQSDTLQQEEKP